MSPNASGSVMSVTTQEARQAQTGASPPRSEVSSSAASPFRRRRFERETRREALERRLLHHRTGVRSTLAMPTTSCNDEKKEERDDSKEQVKNNQQLAQQDAEKLTVASEQLSTTSFEANTTTDPPPVEGWETPPRRTSLQQHLDVVKPSRSIEENTATTTDVTETTVTKIDGVAGYTALSETFSPGDTCLSAMRSIETDTKASSIQHRPLHEDMVYYRVIYRGVVSLLSGPDSRAPRSGHYLGYGEIFGSTQEIALEDDCSIVPTLTARSEDHGSFSAIDSFLDSPPRSIFSQAGSVSSIETFQTKSTTIPNTPQRKPRSIPLHHKEQGNAAIRVEEILTGGYAKDAFDAETPKKSNLDELLQITSGAPGGVLGYLFARQEKREIIQRLTGPPPRVEEGIFRYKLVSVTPLPILTGPAWDAPRTKAMILPGTMLEVSLRVSFQEDSKLTEESGSSDDVWFLRLSHRRGWIVSHRQGRPQAVVREIACDASDVCSIVSARSVITDDAQSVLSSIAVSSVATPGAVSRRRHRPPRRRRRAHARVSGPRRRISG